MTTSQKVAVLCLSEPCTLISPQVGVESAPEELNESPRMPHFGPLEQMSALLVTSLQGGDSFFVFVFYCIHQKFLTTQHVLDLLFRR